jgi:hypothetical protein
VYSKTDSIALCGRHKQSRNSEASEKLPVHKGRPLLLEAGAKFEMEVMAEFIASGFLYKGEGGNAGCMG